MKVSAFVPICGTCVERDAIGRDEDGVPICGPCRVDEVPPPSRFNRIDRVLQLVRRLPGYTAQQLGEILNVDTPEERRALTQLLSRAVQRGQARADGPKTTRRYYVDDTSCKDTSTIDDAAHAMAPSASAWEL